MAVKERCFILVFLFLVAVMSKTYAQETAGNDPVKVAGQIFNKESGEPVPFVHIINRSTHQGAVSDMDGKFSLEIEENNTLFFSSVGFKKLVFIADEAQLKKGYLKIVLTPKVIELDQVDVFAFENAASFKRHILAMELPEKKKAIRIPGTYEGPRKPVKPGLANPISLIQNLFNKEAIEKRKYHEVTEDYYQQKLVDTKFNKEFVQEVTGLEDHALLSDFMIYCNQNLSNEFILNSTEYEIILALNRCYSDFVKRQ